MLHHFHESAVGPTTMRNRPFAIGFQRPFPPGFEVTSKLSGVQMNIHKYAGMQNPGSSDNLSCRKYYNSVQETQGDGYWPEDWESFSK